MPFSTLSVDAPAIPTPNQSTLVISFKYLPESDSLCIILANGDIEQILSIGDGMEEKVSWSALRGKHQALISRFSDEFKCRHH